MIARRHSIKRITGWSGFLAAALTAALIVRHLSVLLNFDQFRPDFIELLEKTFHAQAEIGHIRAELVPSPGLSVSRMALVEDGQPARVLASGSVRVTLSWKSLLSGRPRFTSIRFIRPRFIIHRQPDSQGEVRWISLALPRAGASGRGADVDEVSLRNGSVEVWDHATFPATRWVINGLTGRFRMQAQQGAATGHLLFLGPKSELDLHFQGRDAFPLKAQVTNVSLDALQDLFNTELPALEGTAEASLRARWNPAWDIRADIPSLTLKRLTGMRMKGSASYEQKKLQARLETIASQPMALGVQADFLPGGWNLKGDIKGYDPELIHKLYDQIWLNRLEGRGSLTFAVQNRRRAGPVGPHGMKPVWNWSGEGRGFQLAHSIFQVPQWSALGDARTAVVDVRLATAQGGMGEVVWEKPSIQPEAALTVDVTSVTIRQILEVFNLESKAGTPPATWNPYGYEPWRIEKGSIEAALHPAGVLEVKESDIDMAGLHVDLAGTFGLSHSMPAHIQGDVLQVPLEAVVESFSGSPSPVTGMAQAEFNLTFPLSPHWIRGLSGDVQLYAINGVVRSFKTFYRVMSVLNLTNYFRFRMPQVAAEGIVFQSLVGHLQFQNGLLTTEDLFLKSPNLNIGAKGAVDLIEKRVDTTLRVELFRFLEDVLKSVPITHWIFKKPNKIFLPLVVNVKGPWANPDVN